MTDLGWEQSQLCGQEVPIKSEATIYKLQGSKKTLKKKKKSQLIPCRRPKEPL